LEPSATSRRIAAFLIILYASIALIPMALIVSTAFKSVTDAISYPPKVLSEPSLEGFVNLFTQRTRQSAEYLETLPPPENVV
jgi:multiple sugar transport system permease protein